MVLFTYFTEERRKERKERERERGVIKGKKRKERSEREGGRETILCINIDCLEIERDYTLRKHSIAYPTD